MKRYVGSKAAALRRKPQKQAEVAAGEEPRCLVRARSSKRKKSSKISTVIKAQDMARFQLALGNIMRLHMDGLKRPAKKPAKDQKKGEPKKEGKKKDKGAGKPVKKDSP